MLRNNLRMLRKRIQALDSLFPGVQQGVLAAALGQPGKWWYLSELGAFFIPSHQVCSESSNPQSKVGILQRRKGGHRKYFKAETRSPLF